MALDPQARDVTIPFPGGNCNCTRGLAEALFGPDLGVLEATPVPTNVSVRGHNRVRVIGQPAITVNAHNYTYDKYPTAISSLAEGGQPCIVTLTDGSSWTIRVSGPLNEFATFLARNTALTGIFFTSQRGTKYGPFTVNQN
jgi:hypothetical protein